MPSSISSSERRSCIKIGGAAILIALAVLLGLEGFWRMCGHEPTIVDDQSLWALERSKIGRGKKEIVLLGSSRMQTDISTAALHKLAPGYRVVNLAVESRCGNAVLKDLAADPAFNGVVLLETTAECLMFGDNKDLTQQSYVDYYHKTFNLNDSINRKIGTLVQQNLVVVDPYLNLTKVAADVLLKKRLRPPSYLTMGGDRTRQADYTKLDIAKHKEMRLGKVLTNYRNLLAGISIANLKQKVGGVDLAVKQIQNRGGKVIFIRFPVSDEHWIIDEQYFPRAAYWDDLHSMTAAAVWHFQDLDGIKELTCPDTSHLDVRDAAIFTTLLFNELTKNKLLGPDRHG